MEHQEPDALSEEIKKLEERKSYYEEWMQGFRNAQQAAPSVQQNLAITDWQIRALKSRPPEASEVPYFADPEQLQKENDFLQEVLPPINVAESFLVNSTTSVTTSGSASVFQFVSRVGDINTPAAINYSEAFSREYQQIQAVQQRSQQVKVLLSKLNNPQTLDRFERAFDAFVAYQSKLGARTAAAIEMRTLLDGIKGDLFSRARKWSKENMTWNIMATRLAIGGGSGPLHIRLINQNKARSSLIERLSQVAKDREGGSVTNLEDIWTELLDHIFTVLGMIGLNP